MSKTIKIIAMAAILNLIVFGACFYLFMNIKKVDKVVSERLIQIESEIKKDESIRSIKNLMNDTKKEREQIAGLLGTMGLKTIPLGREELIELLYTNYNPGAILKQKNLEQLIATGDEAKKPN